MEKKKIKYIGVYRQYLECPGFSGHINPGDEIEVFQEAFYELSQRDDFQIIEKKTELSIKIKEEK